MEIKGKVWKYGRDVNTDDIVPARYLYTSDPQELAAHCMEDHDADFLKKISRGDIIVAEENFGCGSSREHAPIALRAAGISCVIARSFARIFYRNAINMGLPIFAAPEAVAGISEGDTVEVDVAAGLIRDLTTGKDYPVAPFPPFIQELIEAGGLVNYVAKKVRSGV